MKYHKNDTLILFAAYCDKNILPEYLKIYLLELRKYAKEMVFINCFDTYITQEQFFFKHHQIDILTVNNEGYDFGMWQKALAQKNLADYKHILLVNDSCILIQPLSNFFNQWANSNADYYGILSSNEKQYHLQSYFIGLNQHAIQVLVNHFTRHGIVKDKRKLINLYEIGLTVGMLKKGLCVDALYNGSGNTNPNFHQLEALLVEGFPLIKKQIALNKLFEHDIKAFAKENIDLSAENIKKIIKKHSALEVDWDKIF